MPIIGLYIINLFNNYLEATKLLEVFIYQDWTYSVK